MEVDNYIHPPLPPQISPERKIHRVEISRVANGFIVRLDRDRFFRPEVNHDDDSNVFNTSEEVGKFLSEALK